MHHSVRTRRLFAGLAVLTVVAVDCTVLSGGSSLPSTRQCTAKWRQGVVAALADLDHRLLALEQAIDEGSRSPEVPQEPQPPIPPSTQPGGEPSPQGATQPSGSLSWLAADGAQRHELVVDPPVHAAAPSLQAERGVDLSNKHDVRLIDRDLGTLPPDCDALHVGNEQTSQRVCVERLSAVATRYGVYLGDARHWRLRDVSITQLAGSPEHALRMHGGRIVLERVTLDSAAAGKRTVWCYADDVAFIDCTLKGGAVWFGAAPGAFPGAEAVTARRILVRGGRIEQTRADMPSAIAILGGSDDIVFEDVAIIAPPGNRAVDVDSRRTGAAMFRRCTFNGRPLKIADIAGEDLSRIVVEQP